MGDSVGSIIGAAIGVAAAPFTAGGSLSLTAAALAGGGLGMMAGSMLIDQPKARKEAEAASNARYAEQLKAQQAQARIAEAQNVRSRLAQLREARVQRATNLARAVNVGGASGTNIGAFSPAAGAMSATQATLGSNLGYQMSQEGLGRSVFASNMAATGYAQQEAAAISDLQMAQTIGGLGSTIFSMGGGFDTLFGKSATVPTQAQPVSNQARAMADYYAPVNPYIGLP